MCMQYNYWEQQINTVVNLTPALFQCQILLKTGKNSYQKRFHYYMYWSRNTKWNETRYHSYNKCQIVLRLSLWPQVDTSQYTNLILNLLITHLYQPFHTADKALVAYKNIHQELQQHQLQYRNTIHSRNCYSV